MVELVALWGLKQWVAISTAGYSGGPSGFRGEAEPNLSWPAGGRRRLRIAPIL
jgi:hypothetical protein